MNDTPRYRARSTPGATALGAGVLVVCLLPVFLTGALAALLMRDLGFGSAGLGFAVATSRATSAASSPYLGRLADHFGATRSVRIAAVGAAVASLGIALTADRWSTLVGWLMLSGSCHALGQPAANRLLATLSSPRRLGLAFGVKQSAPPVASMLAGLSVPLLTVILGWRWSFVAAAVLGVVVAVVAGPTPAKRSRPPMAPRRGRIERRSVVLLLAVAFGLGTAASSSITTFYVDSSVRAGATVSFAGSVLAIASIGAIVVRIGTGAFSDRLHSGHLRLCAGLMFVGALGLGLVASDAPSAMAVGAVLGTAGAWGFNGVFWYALMRSYGQFPGQITGVIAPGALLGHTAGPAVLGVIAEGPGFPLAWAIAAAVALLAGTVMLAADRHVPEPEQM